ncbi:MAG: FHA domain-containing protein [Anaerolineae bacterium]
MTNGEVAMLLVQEGDSPRRQWPLDKSTMIIGRGDDSHIVIEDRQVSRQHAAIERDDGGYILKDLGSKNGTFLNGEPVGSEPQLLKDGDEVGIALCAKLTFVDAGATAPLFFESGMSPRLKMDLAAKRVWVMGKELDPPMSRAQYRLLELLYTNRGKVVGREQVIRWVWSEEMAEGVSEQAIDALARRLRERIAEVDPDTQYIITVRGHGFRLEHAEPLES